MKMWQFKTMLICKFDSKTVIGFCTENEYFISTITLSKCRQKTVSFRFICHYKLQLYCDCQLDFQPRITLTSTVVTGKAIYTPTMINRQKAENYSKY